MGEESGRALGEAFRRNRSLINVNLASNKFGDGGTESIAAALQVSAV